MKERIVLLTVLCSISSMAATRYVAVNGGNVPPYTNWISAATSIQTALDASVSGDTVIVSNGTYFISTHIIPPAGIRLVSLAGPALTVINPERQCRGFYLNTTVCYISGFTITNARAVGDSGGAFYAHPTCTAVISNCIILGNTADSHAGGAHGAHYHDCIIKNNYAGHTGGGVNRGYYYNCLIANNAAASSAGGAAYATLENCTVVSNNNGGTLACYLTNSIAYFNQGWNYTDGANPGYYAYSCLYPITSGPGNISNDPQFVSQQAGDYHLKGISPCVNAGTNLPWMISAKDLDGKPRIIDGRVDLGAYEFFSCSVIVTTPPATLTYATSAVAVAGTNENCSGSLWVSNAANAQVYSFSATPAWTSPDVALEVGPNLITAYGTDTYGMVASSSVTITRKAATPTGVAASDGTFTNKVALAWLAAPGAVSYRILRAETNDSSAATTVATAVSNTIYDDTTATPGLLYYYWLIAQQNGVEGDPSSSDSGYRQLQASASIKATLGERTNSVYITWAPVAGATKYRVYRADSPQTNLAALLAGDITDTNYTDATVTPGLVYYYWVQAQSAVAVSAWSGTTPGYALLAANFADKKMWSMRDTKKYDTLTCKQLPGPWSELLDAGWSIGIADALTHEIVNGPFELVTKNGKLYTYKSATATITYTQRYNKRKDTYKVKLVYKFLGNMPTKPGFYLHPPAGN